MLASPVMTHHAKERDDMRKKAEAALGGCERIGCIHLLSQGGMRACSKHTDRSIVRALVEGKGCDSAQIREQGRTLSVTFDGMLITYQ